MTRFDITTAGAVLASLLAIAPTPASAFYFPGTAPTSYKTGDAVPLYVNRLTPADSQNDPKLRSVFSFDYYHPPFHFCREKDGPKEIRESLGSILFGDRIQTSPFELKMGVNETCKLLCEAPYPGKDAAFVNDRIHQGYDLNWLIDGLPAAQSLREPGSDQTFYQPGFALGLVDEEQPTLNNHYDIVIDYHEPSPGTFRVVGVLVDPYSIAESKRQGDDQATCNGQTPVVLKDNDEDTNLVVFTYGVYWRRSPTPFATRWDKYLHVYDPKIHWFSLINSAVIVVFLVGMVSTILIRTLKKDIARYNRLDQFALEDFGETGDADDTADDSGWKLVHGDVFRPPQNPLLLSVLLGNGAQLFAMTALTIVFALLGFLSPSNRGALGTVIIIFYTLFGFFGGYTAARTYKFFHGESWKLCFFYTPVALPAIVFGVFFLMNLFVWGRGASGAVPFTTMLVVVIIWFVISVPLSVAGSWIGFKQAAIEPPVRTNQIPRQIPPTGGYLRPLPSMALAGVLPFGAIFVELYFIMNSIWFSKVYYMFGFLFICFGLMIITSAAVTVLMIYFLLCAENYHWQWRSFFTAGASAAYVFASCLLYWIKDVSWTSWTSGVVYLGYSALLSSLVFILTGTIGFFASWLFTLKIYRSIKVD
ncbi:endosomal integral membrane protein [Stemphylium lycopersici]|nr:endosomal integral membrane protein [Stemphylium lycopersici]RAR02262.1 endosomal integral membrane protein [Stemphylium lycopersici]